MKNGKSIVALSAVVVAALVANEDTVGWLALAAAVAVTPRFIKEYRAWRKEIESSNRLNDLGDEIKK